MYRVVFIELGLNWLGALIIRLVRGSCESMVFISHACRLHQLEVFADRVSSIHSVVDERELTSHLHNPVNSLQLVGRFTNEWRKLADLVYQDNSHGRCTSRLLYP